MNQPTEWTRSDRVQRWGIARLLLARSSAVAGRYLKLHIHTVHRGSFNLAPREDDPDVPENVTLKNLNLADIEAAQGDPALDLRPATFKFALAYGHRPLGLYVDNRLVHYTIYGDTVAPGPDGLVVRSHPDYLYIYRTFTHPEFRGRHLPKIRGVLARRQWQGRTYRGVVSYIAADNLSSRAQSERFDEPVVGYAGYFSRPGFAGHGPTRCFATAGARVLGFRFDQPSQEEQLILDNARN